jgi:hypothetical protein
VVGRVRAAERVADVRHPDEVADERGGELPHLVNEQVGPPLACQRQQVRDHRRYPVAGEQPREDLASALLGLDVADVPEDLHPQPVGLRTGQARRADARPAAVTSVRASSPRAHSTSCPAARAARASGTIGSTCPWPLVEENRTRTRDP